MAEEQVEVGYQRVSITVPAKTKKGMRIAAAVRGMTVSEWANEVLDEAADRAIPADLKRRITAKKRRTR